MVSLHPLILIHINALYSCCIIYEALVYISLIYVCILFISFNELYSCIPCSLIFLLVMKLCTLLYSKTCEIKVYLKIPISYTKSLV